jgi:hypothetical protein
MNKWLAHIEAMVNDATHGMTEAQLAWHPEGKWSTAQILEHLMKTYKGTSRGFEKAVEAGKSLATRATPWQHFARMTVVNFGYFPSGRKSPALVVPGEDCKGAETLACLRTELAKLIEAQKIAEEKFSGTKIVDHPVMGPLTPEEWAKFHYVHAKHHMRQVKALRQQMATMRRASA